MSTEANKTEVMRQISAAWDLAKSQLEELRSAVQRHSELASVKLQSTFLQREKDQALRDFGAAVFEAVHAGQVQLPPHLVEAMKEIDKVERKLEIQAAEVATLLSEGSEAADRLRGASPQKNAQTVSKGVAPGIKRR